MAPSTWKAKCVTLCAPRRSRTIAGEKRFFRSGKPIHSHLPRGQERHGALCHKTLIKPVWVTRHLDTSSSSPQGHRTASLGLAERNRQDPRRGRCMAAEQMSRHLGWWPQPVRGGGAAEAGGTSGRGRSAAAVQGVQGLGRGGRLAVDAGLWFNTKPRYFLPSATECVPRGHVGTMTQAVTCRPLSPRESEEGWVHSAQPDT